MRPRHLWMGVVAVVVSAALGWAAPQETTASVSTTAQGSHLVTYRGVLKDAAGSPRSGTLTMVFTLWLLIDGGVGMVLSIVRRGPGWGWWFTSSTLSLILGVLLTPLRKKLPKPPEAFAPKFCHPC